MELSAYGNHITVHNNTEKNGAVQTATETLQNRRLQTTIKEHIQYYTRKNSIPRKSNSWGSMHTSLLLLFLALCPTISWSRPFEAVKVVHMVYMTHWDSTFTDFRRGVCDVYMNATGQCHSTEPQCVVYNSVLF